MKIRIIGIGQSLRSDDGAGLSAIQVWQAKFPQTAHHPSITIDQVELPGLDLLNLLEGFDYAIIVDAVQSSAPPGTIRLLNESDLLGFAEDHQTAHGWGVAETLQLGRQLSLNIPETIQIIGLEGENFAPGPSLSSSVSSAIDRAAQVIEDSVKIFLNPHN